MAEGRKKPPRRTWGMRLGAVAGSIALFAGFWQLAARQPHPLGFGQAATPTPTDSYGVPGAGQGNPIPLPGNPHSGTGLSH
jgi:hypothetical protein